MSAGSRVVTPGAIWLVRGYQRFLSPLLPRACRFSPTCSEYARQVLLCHGLVRGSWLTARRLLRCHPLHPGGYDPPSPRRLTSPKERKTWKSG